MSQGSDRLRTVKGTRDLLPPETALWQAVERAAHETFALYGFAEIRTPVLESTELFVRGVGESTDIVGKEMYTFDDRKGRSVTLRPESTASVARAYLQHNLEREPQPQRLYYLGPQFRYERPQRGRYRQFHQIGAEVIGDEGPWSDVELLVMLVRFLRRLGFEGLEVQLNTVGDRESRGRYAEALRSYFAPHRDLLGEDSLRRLGTNPLRILDTKVPAEQELLGDAPQLADHLSSASGRHFDAVCRGLEESGIAYAIAPRLVRGLDYYTRTVFEIASDELGAQDAILGGGRYDGLTEQLGGPAIPGIGFAIGEDRLIEILPESARRELETPAPVIVLPIGEVGPLEVLRVAEAIRAAGVAVETDLAGGSLKSALKRANRRGAERVVLCGAEEMARNAAVLRDFTTGEQDEVAVADLPARLRRETREP